MIKIEHTTVTGWEAALRGMRNPKNSWARSDTVWQTNCGQPIIGEKDKELMSSLCKGGSEHRKFLRMINVTCDITAPVYWVSEHDTYKVGTTRNSCSFMHKGVEKPFSIDDFTVSEKVAYLLSPLKTEHADIQYPYETEEFKPYVVGQTAYRVYKNGRVFAEDHQITDASGRVRHFKAREVQPYKNVHGYFELNLGGRAGEKWQLHRLVASLWIPNPDNLETVDHINCDKSNNSADNLRWLTRSDNCKSAWENREIVYDSTTLRRGYSAWKTSHTVVDPLTKRRIKAEYQKHEKSPKVIAEEYDISYSQLFNLVRFPPCENEALFVQAYVWEQTIDILNKMREEYLLTKDEKIFRSIRALLPSGYNVRYTWQANYEVLGNIYRQRRNHRLPEWREFCAWISELPNSWLITGEVQA